MSDAYLVGTCSTAFAKRPLVPHRTLANDAVRGALTDAGLDPVSGAEIDSIGYANCAQHLWGQANVRGQMTLVGLVDAGVLPARAPVTNVEAACASGSLALHGAVREVRTGDAGLALALGVEKLALPGAATDQAVRERTFEMFEGCMDNLSGDRRASTFRAVASALGTPFDPKPARSPFMDTYALQALDHMARYGTTREQIAAGCAKNHNYGALNPLAQYRFRTTVEEVLADRPVVHPLTRAMCAPIGDGAAAALVCSADWLAGQPAAVRDRALKVSGVAAAGGGYARTFDQPSLSYHAARTAYARADIKPALVDIAEVHDATSFSEIVQIEMLGFCAEGAGGAMVADGATGPGGEAGSCQVPDARVGLAENGGGAIGLEEAICAVTIIERK